MHKSPPGIPNELLTYEREKQEWTQQELADKIDSSKEFKGVVTVKTIQRWEKGSSAPTSAHLGQLCKIFNKSPSALGCPPEDEISLWYVPHQHNAFFTERAGILQQIQDTFLAQRTGSVARQPLALTGLGGIGKSQIAAEYAYRCRRHVYEDPFPVHTILWLQASSRQALMADMTAIAQVLDLPGKDAANIQQVVAAFKVWLTELTRWLLIFDDVEDFNLLKDMLPDEIQGRVLVTTSSQATGTFARAIPVEPLHTDAGARLLLRRAKRISIESPLEQAAPADVASARTLSDMLGGLPLALDQAGAYIEESVSLARYIQLYQNQKERLELLKRRGIVVSHTSEHPESVVVTLSLSMQKARKQHPMARDILRFCAFLQPDAIPEELFQSDGGFQFDSTVFSESIAALQRYSLVRQQTQEQTISMHRLVQTVVSDRMDANLSKQWRVRVMRTLNATFPEGDFHEWAQCGRLLPHVVGCATWAEHELPSTLEVAALLCKAGVYLRERGQYADAEPLLLRARSICELHAGGESLETAKVLDALTNLYWHQGKYAQAEPLCQQARLVRERQLGPEHLETATSLNNLAVLYQLQGKYAQAEPLCRRVLEIREKQLGEAHPNTAASLNNLANLCQLQGKYDEAEPLYQRAIAITERCLGDDHPDTAMNLSNLAALYRRKSEYEQAELLYQRAIAIRKKHLGVDHPDTAMSLNNLAILYKDQGKYEQAEPLYQEALAIRERRLGTDHPDTARNLDGLASLYWKQGRHEEAKSLYHRALAIKEKHLGGDHPDTARSLYGLAQLYQQTGDYEQAEAFYRRALAIQEQRLPAEHPHLQETKTTYAELLRETGRHVEANSLEPGGQLSV